LGLYALVGGLISLAGWPADLPRLADWFNNGISIQPNTTVAATLSGMALLCLGWGFRRAAAVLGILVGLIGASALIQYVVDGDFTRLNTTLMFNREWGRTGVIVPGRMGPPGSTCWTLIGAALILNGFDSPRARRIVPRIALTTFAIAGLSVVGYFYGADRLFSLPYVTVIAFQTATFIAAVSAGIIAAIPEHAPTRWILDEGATGQVARRAIPLIILLPFVAGWLRLWGESRGLYDAPFGVAILVLVLVILLLALLSWTLRTISVHESSLRDSERRVTSTLESITDGFVTIDRDWKYRFVNAEAARLMQRPAGEFLDKSPWELFPEALNGKAYQQLHRAAADRVSVEFDDYNPELKRWFANRVYPTNDGSLTIYFQDITARKEAEAERVADVAGLSRLQVLSTKLVQSGDLSSLLQEIVAAAAQLTGTTKGQIQFHDAETGRLRVFVHQGFGQTFLDRFTDRGSEPGCERAARSHQRVVCDDIVNDPMWQGNDDLRVLLDDGIRAFQSTPLLTRNDRLLGVLSTHFTAPHRLSDREVRHLDLLARMAADFIERSHAEATLKNADRMKDEFLAMLAHELRNPMAPILNAAQILRATQGSDDTVRSTTDMLQRQVGQLVRLTDDLVDVSRISRGRIELVRQPVELAAIIRQAAEAATPVFEAQQQTLEVLLPHEPVHVDGDAARLAQVVGNMLSNAAKFSKRGDRVLLQAGEVPGGLVAIRVRDEGIGIATHDLPRIFDMFMQGDTSLERSVSGLGIGLTLVKTLVELHGGSVHASSEGEGKGSEFVVRLPTVSGASPVPSATPVNGAPQRSHRILIVDDNHDGAASLANVLMLAGHVTLTANDGLAALGIAEQFRPDVVLLDIGLPKLNGYETCRRMRAQTWGRHIRLVALTGWGQEKYRQRSAEAGFDAHMVKPVDPESLIRMLNRA
jgi:PAS domain S-box-containing protein